MQQKNAPRFETNEAFDCGEGIHLMGVDHSIVSGNVSENNAGGILLSDATGATRDNLITSNMVRNNPSDCGITLASHTPAAITGAALSLGVFHNTSHGETVPTCGMVSNPGLSSVIRTAHGRAS